MKVCFSLLKYDFMNTFSVAKFLKSKGKGSKVVGAAIVALLILVAIVYYEYSVLNLFIGMNMQLHFFLIIGIVCSAITLFQTIRTAPAQLFNFKDYDLLFSMPIKEKYILIEKVVVLYLSDLFTNLVIALPAFVLYAILDSPPTYFYFLAIPLLIALPVLSIILGCLLSMIITLIASKFKNEKLINIILYIVYIAGMMLIGGFFGYMGDSGAGAIVAIINPLGSSMMKNPILLPVKWFVNGLINGNALDSILLIGLSIAAFILFTYAFSKIFYKINALAKERPKKSSKFSFRNPKSNTVLSALIKKDWGFVTINATSIMNVFIGPFFTLLFAIAAFVLTKYFSSDLGMLFESIHLFDGYLSAGILAIFLYFLNLMPPSSFLISIEGKSFWISKGLPISTTRILWSKILLHLQYALPIVAISLILFELSFKLDLNIIIALGIIAILDAVLASIFSLLVNLTFPRMKWEKLAQVIKQSASTMTITLTRILLVAALIFVYIKSGIVTGPGYSEGTSQFFLIMIIVQLVALVVSIILLNTFGKKRFNSISA